VCRSFSDHSFFVMCLSENVSVFVGICWLTVAVLLFSVLLIIVGCHLMK